MANLPGILEVGRSLVIPIAALKVRRTNGKNHGASRSLDSVYAREFALRVDGGFVFIKIAGQEIVQTSANRMAEYFAGLIVGAVTAVVPQIFDGASKAEFVPALGQTKVLVGLAEVLRSAKGIAAVAGRKRLVSGQRHIIGTDCGGGLWTSKIIHWRHAVRRYGLDAIETVEIEFGLRHKARRESVRQGDDQTV